MIASCHICLAQAALAISGPANAAKETPHLTRRLSAFWIFVGGAGRLLRRQREPSGCVSGGTAAPATRRTNGHFIRAAAGRWWVGGHLTGWSAPALDVARGNVDSHQQHRAVVYLGFAETQ